MNGSPRFNRLAVAALVFLGAAGVAVWQQLEWRMAQRTVARLDEELAVLRRERAAAEESRTLQRRKLSEERDQGAAEAAKLALALSLADPALAAAAWVRPPAQLPAWDAASPYVWLRKELLAQFPFDTFDATGQLNPEVATMLAVTPDTKRHLTAKLNRLLADSRNAEVARAERSEESPSGLGDEAGAKLTIRVPPLPDAGASGRQQFEDALRADLGEGRAALLEKLAADWVDSNFNDFGSKEQVISILHHPDGTYTVAIKTGTSGFSSNGMTSVDDYVPAHLRPLLQGFGEAASTTPVAKPTAGTP